MPHGDGIEARLSQAVSLPETLAAGFDVFEAIRITARKYQDQATALFAAFMTAADAAVDGREALTAAPSLPLADSQPDIPAMLTDADTAQVADALRELGSILHRRLTQAASLADAPGDQDACLDAAAAADRICQLMARTDP